jgi:hypothetical protein
VAPDEAGSTRDENAHGLPDTMESFTARPGIGERAERPRSPVPRAQN